VVTARTDGRLQTRRHRPHSILLVYRPAQVRDLRTWRVRIGAGKVFGVVAEPVYCARDVFVPEVYGTGSALDWMKRGRCGEGVD